MSPESEQNFKKTKEVDLQPKLKEVDASEFKNELVAIDEENTVPDPDLSDSEQPAAEEKPESEEPEIELGELPKVYPGFILLGTYVVSIACSIASLTSFGSIGPLWMFLTLATAVWWSFSVIQTHNVLRRKFKDAPIESDESISLTKIMHVLMISIVVFNSLLGFSGMSSYEGPPAWLSIPIVLSVLVFYLREAIWSFRLGSFIPGIYKRKLLPDFISKPICGFLYTLNNIVLFLLFPTFGPILAPIYVLINNAIIKDSQKEGIDPTKDKDKKIIRYRPFATIEQWMKQRFMSNKSLRNRPILIVLLVMLIPALIAMGYAASTEFLGWITAVLSDPNALDPNSPLTQASNKDIARMFVFSVTAIILTALGFYAISTTHLQFSSRGITFLNRRGANWVEKSHINWDEIESITIKGEGTSSVLHFNAKSGGIAKKLSLNSVPTIEERQDILEAIEKFAPHIKRSSEVILALQLPAEHSYTELWLQALAAPPKRERLQPLSTGALIKDERYEIQGKLGVGGQGFAYLAKDRTTEEVVVLKEFILPVFVDIEVRKQALQDFEGEAKILSRLDHGQIVKLIDFMVEDHRAYLVLEHIDGKSLRQIVKEKGKLSESEVKDLAVQMCTLLEYLHSQSPPVVHRDFTPDNLILKKDGTLKLIDFNVAQQTDSTTIAKVVGKQAYLPPEQFQGQPTTQSDIYAMGCTLHYLLTGEDPVPISESHPKETVPEISAKIDKVVAKATAVKKENRFLHAQELLDGLDYELEEQPEIEAERISEEHLAKESKPALKVKDFEEKEGPTIRLQEGISTETAIVLNETVESKVDELSITDSEKTDITRDTNQYPKFMKYLNLTTGYVALFMIMTMIAWMILPNIRPILDPGYDTRVEKRVDRLNKQMDKLETDNN